MSKQTKGYINKKAVDRIHIRLSEQYHLI